MHVIDIKEKDFGELFDLVYEASGINLYKGKEELLKAKIAKRMRVKKIVSAKEYVKQMKKDPNEFIEFIDTITTNHTFFFRENKGCEYLIKKLAPQYANTPKILKIWSAASSTGEEPYSIALQLLTNGFNFRILATDISHTVLSFAKRGIYPKERARNVPVPILHQYFQKGFGERKDYIRIKKDVRNYVTFKKFNLIADSLPNESFDIIFCRNVMIYFDDKTTEKVVNKLCRSLRYKGYFIIGQSESLMSVKHGLTSVKMVPSMYLK